MYLSPWKMCRGLSFGLEVLELPRCLHLETPQEAVQLGGTGILVLVSGTLSSLLGIFLLFLTLQQGLPLLTQWFSSVPFSDYRHGSLNTPLVF